jgi:hypothetical protein
MRLSSSLLVAGLAPLLLTATGCACNDRRAGDCDGPQGADTPWYVDGDGDGFGEDGSAEPACAQPAGAVLVGGDCDDDNPAVHPKASEECDGLDNDCDGEIDEGLSSDADGDGHAAEGEAACGIPDDDCDDECAECYPGADEICDGLDNDCDGAIDDDRDGDCVTPCGVDGIAGTADDDCDENNPRVAPGLAEVCDGYDNDCSDGGTLSDPAELDRDGDGFVACSDFVAGHPDLIGGDDCDDFEPLEFPGNPEICDNLDNDCDGGFDNDGDGDGVDPCSGDCAEGVAEVYPGAAEVCDGFDTDCSSGSADPDDPSEQDNDADGYVECDTYTDHGADLDGGEDCDDTDAATHPSAGEACDGVDNNCDGLVDEDLDADGVSPCGPDGTAGTADDDCDDREPLAFPGAAEDCDGLDNDCNGTVDDGHDLDGDGVTTCAGDCDDADPAVHGRVRELCDGLDNNCNGLIDLEEDFALHLVGHDRIWETWGGSSQYYTQSAPNANSIFGFTDHLTLVWWLDVVPEGGVFQPGRYQVRWRMFRGNCGGACDLHFVARGGDCVQNVRFDWPGAIQPTNQWVIPPPYEFTVTEPDCRVNFRMWNHDGSSKTDWEFDWLMVVPACQDGASCCDDGDPATDDRCDQGGCMHRCL